MEKKFKVESSILVMAMRYAMGRQTFAPTTVVDSIKNNISLLDSNQIELLIRDIEEYGESFSFGMDCDEGLWLDFRDYLVNVLGSKNKDSSKDIEDLLRRVKILMQHQVLPYVARFEEFKKSRHKGMYITISRWCNQPHMFKKMSLREFAQSNQTLKSDMVCAPVRYLRDFEAEYPEIAEKYFDMKFEDFGDK